MASKTTVLTVAAVVATGVLAYAVYFDYKRRNDVEFRKKLKKERKRVNKTVEQTKQVEETSADVDAEILREALKALKTEPPVPMEEREQYFMTQISMGEQLAAQGPTFYVPAAIAFFRALRIYPAPAELIGIYQSTVHPPVFKLVIEMTNMDVTERVRGYYDVFPPKSMNVEIVPQESKSMVGVRQSAVVTRDIAAGEVIYKEHPVVAVLDQDVQLAGTHCTHCFRVIESGKAVKTEDTSRVLPSAYCSEICLNTSKQQSQNILFTLENPLPDALMAGPTPNDMTEKRKEAQTAFIEGHKGELRNVPLLTARFIARQVAAETKKLLAATALSAKDSDDKNGDFTDAQSGDYTLADHTERFRYTEVAPPEHDLKLVTDLLSATLPGLEEFTTAERYAAMEAKMLYNAYGVCFDNGRDDKPAPVRSEDLERTRTPYGTASQIGSALYTLSSYLTHACDPSARTAFTSGTTELSVIANRPLKKGDVVTIAFVDVSQHSGETTGEARRRRRFELARGWKFACGCQRCAEENVAGADEDKKEEPPVLDEAKVDEAVRNYELNLPRKHEPEPEPEVVPVAQDEARVAAEEKIEEKLEEAILDKVEEKIKEMLEDTAEVETSEPAAAPVIADAAVEAAFVEVVEEAIEEVVQDTVEEALAAVTQEALEQVDSAQVAVEVVDEAQANEEAVVETVSNAGEVQAEKVEVAERIVEEIQAEEEVKEEVQEGVEEVHAAEEPAVEADKEVVKEQRESQAEAHVAEQR